MAAAILLAAGESTRMRRPKALLPWGETTLIQYQVRELRAAGVDGIVVVLGHAADEIRPHVPSGARVVVNEGYRQGRASSLRVGAAALPDNANPIIVLNVDQPRPRRVIKELLAAHRDAAPAVTLPVHEGKRGHPPVLSGGLLPDMRAASEETHGLRAVIASHETDVREVELGEHVVLLDVNTPDEYEQALAEFALSPPS